jgi:hypothetical protein
MTGKERNEMSMSQLADAAFKAVARKVVKRARDSGTDIVLWRNGEVVNLSPDEIEQEWRAAEEVQP